MSQINGNEMFHFSTIPKSDSLPGGVSAGETRFLLSVVIKSNRPAALENISFQKQQNQNISTVLHILLLIFLGALW